MLPNIVDELLKALHHFDPIAQQAYPAETSKTMLARETAELTKKWLDRQFDKAYNEYQRNQGQEVYE